MTTTQTRAKSRKKTPDASCERQYEVGYGKPPKSRRFREGQHPPKRKEGNESFSDVLARVLSEKKRIRKGDGEKVVTVWEALVYSIQQKALTGEPKAMRNWLLLTAEAQMLAPAPTRPFGGGLAIPAPVTSEEFERLAALANAEGAARAVREEMERDKKKG